MERVICQTCQGSKQLQPVFVSYEEGYSGPPVQFLPCYMCNGEGSIDANRMRWIEHGEGLRAARLERELTLRAFSEAKGMSVVEISRIERGEVDNLAIGLEDYACV